MKYNNKKIIYNGIKFDSKKEYQRYLELSLLERAGHIKDLRLQVKFELIPKCKGERATTYIADFVYIENGQQVVEDVKGMKTEVYKIKKKLMNWVHDIQIREI